MTGWYLENPHDDYYLHTDGRVWPRLSTVLSNYTPFNPPPEIPKHVLEAAADLGTNAHAAIAMQYGHPAPAPGSLPAISERGIERAGNATEGWRVWHSVFKPQPEAVELTLDCPGLLFACTLDFVGIMPSGKRWLIDWKTSGELDRTRGVAQLAGQGEAWDSHHPDKPIDFYAIVRLDKDDAGLWEMAVWKDVQGAVDLLQGLSALQWATWPEEVDSYE